MKRFVLLFFVIVVTVLGGEEKKLEDAMIDYIEATAYINDYTSWHNLKNLTVLEYIPIKSGRLVFKPSDHTTDCSLEASSNRNTCPSHYEIRERNGMEPKMRKLAVCNCASCLPKNKSGKCKMNQFSKCIPVFSYYPALRLTQNNRYEFIVEQVPTSCACTFNLNNR